MKLFWKPIISIKYDPEMDQKPPKMTENRSEIDQIDRKLTGSSPEAHRKTDKKHTLKLLSLAHTFGSILLLNDLTRLKWDVLLNSGLSFLKLFSTLFLNQLENVLAQFQLPRRSNEFNTPTQKHAYTSSLHTSLLIGHQLSVCGWRGLKKRIFTHQACISFLKIPKDIPVLYFCKNK